MSADDASTFENIRAVDTQVAQVGYRLAAANAALCDDLEPGLGIVLHTTTQYERGLRDEAIRHFRFDGPIGVEAVLPGSPADKAGLAADDTLVGVSSSGQRIEFDAADAQGPANTNLLIKATGQIAHIRADIPLQIFTRRGGDSQVRTIAPLPACRTRFEVVTGPEFIAKADGEMVQIGSRFLADYPDLIAAPIAHELAHNILHHRQRLEARGVEYGIMSGFGKSVGYFRQTELEADILSVSLLRNAGYDPKMALRFWRRFGPAHAGGILRSRSHPAWQDRLATLELAIKQLEKNSSSQPLVWMTRNRPLDGDWQKLLVLAK